MQLIVSLNKTKTKEETFSIHYLLSLLFYYFICFVSYGNKTCFFMQHVANRFNMFHSYKV